MRLRGGETTGGQQGGIENPTGHNNKNSNPLHAEDVYRQGAAVHLALAQALRHKELTLDARDHLEHAKRVAEEAAEKELLFEAVHELGQIAMINLDYSMAKEHFTYGAELANANEVTNTHCTPHTPTNSNQVGPLGALLHPGCLLQDPRGAAKCNEALSLCHHHYGSFPEAVHHAHRAREGYKGLKDSRGEARACSRLGIEYGSIDPPEFQQAIKWARHALALSGVMGDCSAAKKHLRTLASLAKRAGKVRLTVEMDEVSVALARV